MFIHITYRHARGPVITTNSVEEQLKDEIIQTHRITRLPDNPYLIFGTRPVIDSRCLLDIESFWIEDD